MFHQQIYRNMSIYFGIANLLYKLYHEFNFILYWPRIKLVSHED